MPMATLVEVVELLLEMKADINQFGHIPYEDNNRFTQLRSPIFIITYANDGHSELFDLNGVNGL